MESTLQVTFAYSGEVLHLMYPGVVLEQLQADEALVTHAAGEARLPRYRIRKYYFVSSLLCHSVHSGRLGGHN